MFSTLLKVEAVKLTKFRNDVLNNKTPNDLILINKKRCHLKKLLSVSAGCLAFFGVFAQSNSDIEQYTSQKPQYGFIENKGQIHDQNYKANPDVKYLLCMGNGMNVQLKANGFSYDTYKTEVKEKVNDDSYDKMRPNNKPEKDITYYFHRVDVELAGANTNPEIIAEEPSSDYLNYYNAVTPESGATFVRYYGKITYREIYPGIDMVFVASAGKDKPVEYTFVVNPGADAGLIKLHYIGAEQTKLIDNKINIDVAQGSFTESIPASWIKETNNNLNITYRALDKDMYCFEIPSYAPTQTLIIDPNPNLDWGTYYGGNALEYGKGISCDAVGNVFVTGYTESTTGIATSGAHQGALPPPFYTDAFVVKFNTNGVRQWGTYYGGGMHDYGEGISCDAVGNVFVTGYTESTTGIATSGAHLETHTEDNLPDAFVVKFNTNGVRQWGTYYGGNGIDQGWGISCDAVGNVFVTGYTESTTGIATSEAHQETYKGGWDAFVAKFSTTNNIIVENGSSSIIIYPNPVTHELIIEATGNQEAFSFEIFNTLGQIIYKGNLIEKTTVQTSNFAPGIYVVKLANGKTIEFKKIVKE